MGNFAKKLRKKIFENNQEEKKMKTNPKENEGEGILHFKIPTSKASSDKIKIQKTSEKEPDKYLVDEDSLVKVDDFKVHSKERGTSRVKFFIPKDKEEQKELIKKSESKVSVINKDDEKKEVDWGDLKEIIKTSNDIQQVIVEQIRLMDAARVRLVFDLENPEQLEKQKFDVLEKLQSEKKITSQEVTKKEVQSKKIDLYNLEQKINRDLFKEREDEKIEEAEIIKEVQKEKSDIKINSEVKSPDTIAEAPSESTTTPKDIAEKEDKEDKVLSLANQQKDVSEEGEQGKQLSVRDDDNVEYRKVVFLRKPERKVMDPRYFYQAKNHLELFKLGSSYHDDYKNGLKSFAFNSVGLDEERQQTVFGLSAFFGHQVKIEATIIAYDLENTFYLKKLGDLTRNKQYVFDEGLAYEYYSTTGLKIISFRELVRLAQNFRRHGIEEFLQDLVEKSDLVLWDLPNMDVMDKHKEIYFPVTRMIDYVTFVVRKDDSRISDINRMIDYYNKYNVRIKGIVMSTK